MKLLALGLIGAAVGIAGYLFFLLRRGQAWARATACGDVQKWHELNTIRLTGRPWMILAGWARRLRWPWRIHSGRWAIKTESFWDPVDGTLFDPGEAVIRCACGTAYHLHSWQWLAEKNGSKCVSCKRVVMATTVMLPKVAG